MGGKGEGFIGTCIKDTGYKNQREVESRVGMAGVWRLVGGKWRLLYLSNNRKSRKNK